MYYIKLHTSVVKHTMFLFTLLLQRSTSLGKNDSLNKILSDLCLQRLPPPMSKSCI